MPSVVQQPKKRIRLPFEFSPRKYQVPILSALDRGMKRAVWVVHRRGGKDTTLLNYAAKKMFERVGAYYHFFPTYTQAKKIIWDGTGSSGRKFLSYFPDELFHSKNSTELKITATNGSVYQLIGSDSFDSIVGTNPVGCVFSEYALQDPRAWDYIRPILAENGGWAAFIYTPRGRNHGYDLAQMAKNNPAWFYEILTARDTTRDDGTPVIDPAMIQAEREAGMSEEMIQQEFYCSFDAAIQGAYYGKQIQAAREAKRITSIPHVTGSEVDTFWDLGVDDSMTIWFMQRIGKEFRFIDYYENSGFGLEYYAKELKAKDYTYGNHYMPHDANIREMTSGEIARSRREVAISLGIKPVIVVERARNIDTIVNVHIEAVRNVLSQCWFDEKKCSRGLAALEGYRSEYDEDKKKLSNRPLHDWTSHGADGFRTFAVGYAEKIKPKESKPAPAFTGPHDWQGL